MKKIILYTLLLVIPAASFSQSTTDNAPVVKTDYLQKSKKQKTAAWVLLGGGTLLSSIGLVIAADNVFSGIGIGSSGSYNTGMVLFYTGGAAMFGSIPFFISSAKNKRKAMSPSAGLKMEKAPVFKQSLFTQNSYPAISLKISL
jgi:hypothetical protein